MLCGPSNGRNGTRWNELQMNSEDNGRLMPLRLEAFMKGHIEKDEQQRRMTTIYWRPSLCSGR